MAGIAAKRSLQPISVPPCSYSSQRKDHMTKHVRTHTKETPFACPYCTYRCSTKSLPNKHIRTRTEEVFTCPHCSLWTSSKSTIDDHVRMCIVQTSLREESYTCSSCSYPGPHRRALQFHKKHHCKGRNSKRKLLQP